VRAAGTPTKTALTHGLALLSALTLAWLLYIFARGHMLAEDLVHSYLPATHALLHGHDPYLLEPVTATNAFVYPPLAGYIWAPLTLFSSTVAAALATALTVAAIPLTLAAVGVRDWRCYPLALLWFPSLWGIQTANLTVFLVLGTAVVWRYRDRSVAAGVGAGLLVALKLYVWPLIVFLAITRRWRAAATAWAAAVVFVVVPWSWNGFAGLAAYPHRIAAFNAAKHGNSYSLGALVAPYTGWATAQVLVILTGLAVLWLAWHHRKNDALALVSALAASIAFSPVVRPEYFLVLLVVLGVTRIPFGWAWFLPLAYVLAWQSDQLAGWRIAAGLVITAAAFGLCFARRTRERGGSSAAWSVRPAVR
jgi:alpha-1,2-mannosyltransferase